MANGSCPAAARRPGRVPQESAGGMGGGGFGGMMGGMGGMGGGMGGVMGGGGVQKAVGVVKNWNDEKGFGFIGAPPT